MINSSYTRCPVAKLVNKHLDKRDKGCTKSNLKDNKKESLKYKVYKEVIYVICTILKRENQDFRFQPHCSQQTVQYISDKMFLAMSA